MISQSSSFQRAPRSASYRSMRSRDTMKSKLRRAGDAAIRKHHNRSFTPGCAFLVTPGTTAALNSLTSPLWMRDVGRTAIETAVMLVYSEGACHEAARVPGASRAGSSDSSCQRRTGGGGCHHVRERSRRDGDGTVFRR